MGEVTPTPPHLPPWEVPVGVIPHPVRGNPENSPLSDLGHWEKCRNADQARKQNH